MKSSDLIQVEGAELKFTTVIQGVQGQLGVTAITHLRHKLLEKETNLSFQFKIMTKNIPEFFSGGEKEGWEKAITIGSVLICDAFLILQKAR